MRVEMNAPDTANNKKKDAPEEKNVIVSDSTLHVCPLEEINTSWRVRSACLRVILHNFGKCFGLFSYPLLFADEFSNAGLNVQVVMERVLGRTDRSGCQRMRQRAARNTRAVVMVKIQAGLLVGLMLRMRSRGGCCGRAGHGHGAFGARDSATFGRSTIAIAGQQDGRWSRG